jgi:hypothetical protein
LGENPLAAISSDYRLPKKATDMLQKAPLHFFIRLVPGKLNYGSEPLDRGIVVTDFLPKDLAGESLEIFAVASYDLLSVGAEGSIDMAIAIPNNY